MNDVATALAERRLVEVKRPTQVGVARGWEAARHIIRERLPMWLVAAGLEVPPMPPVDGFADLDAIMAVLDSLDLSAAIHLAPDVRTEGTALALGTHIGPLRAVEQALQHARYPAPDLARLCAVQARLERVLPMLGALAVARHREMGSGEFDLGPWSKASEALAERIV